MIGAGTGSPPRMRERHVSNTKIPDKTGITPAYAGKTECSVLVGADREDHPRVCGKDFWRYASIKAYLGSPPRMRERRVRWDSRTPKPGITPAYAGKTLKNPNKIATSSKKKQPNLFTFQSKLTTLSATTRLYSYERNFSNPFTLKTSRAVNLASVNALWGTDSATSYSRNTVSNL